VHGEIPRTGGKMIPLHEVIVARELGTYGQFLELAPGVLMSPNPQFIVRLITDSVSHQAYLRNSMGDSYKNFENHVRGKHKVSPSTMKILARKAGVQVSFIEEMYGASPNGPLLEPLLFLFQAIEHIPNLVASSLKQTPIKCPCCGHNVLHDADYWWHKNGNGINGKEAAFAERLLNALMLIYYCSPAPTFPKNNRISRLEVLMALTNPDRHPIGNWISIAESHHGVSSLVDFEKALFASKAHSDNTIFRYSRLKKWSSGQDVMPIEAAEKIATLSGMHVHGKNLFLISRSLALIIDFVEGAFPFVNDSKSVNKRNARSIIQNRISKLNENYQLIRQYWLKYAENKLEKLSKPL